MKDPSFTERELDIMSVLWRMGSGSVSEVREILGESVGYTTILKILQILEMILVEERSPNDQVFPACQILMPESIIDIKSCNQE